MPRLNGRRSTRAPWARATSAVRSAEPSSITTISKPASKARISSTTRPMQSSSLRAGTIATRRRALERPRGRGGVEAGVRAPGEVQVDPCGGDRAVEGVEGDVADEARAAGVALEVAPAEGEVDLRQAAARLADERAHPVAAELVAVAVEEDVRLLLDGERPEELRVGGPEDGLGAPGAELLEAGQAALGVREHEVVLGRVGAVVVVEARVHAAELGQAHRHVAVVEDDRDAEALAQVRRDPAQVAHRDGEDDDSADVALALEDPLEVAPPARRHPAPDQLALQPAGVAGLGLGAPQVAVALEPGGDAAGPRIGLALAVGRVRRRPPPGALDRPAAVRRDDQVDARLVHPLPELPPGGRAAVAKVEVDGRGDREDLGPAHAALSMPAACVGSVSPVPLWIVATPAGPGARHVPGTARAPMAH